MSIQNLSRDCPAIFRGFWSMIWTKIGQKLDLKVDMRTKTGFEEDNIWIYEPKPGQK